MLLAGDDAAPFDIDGATGQITTTDALDYEAPGDADTNNEYEVTVMVIDSSGDSSGTESNPDIIVTITVIDVNEDPGFGDATPAGMVADHTEDDDDLIIGTSETDAVNTFTATDPEGAAITLSLSGADSDKFEFIELETPVANSKMVAFKEKPDFENPGDSNRDNIYEVTVQASDTVNTTRRSVTVKVTDADEDGKVSLSTQDAVVGSPITAELEDSDGEIARETWQWESVTPAAGSTCAEVMGPVWVEIDDASAATYTPAPGDNGDCLRAMVLYMDRTITEVDIVDPADDADPGDDTDNPIRFINTATSVSTTAVRDDPANQTPTFNDGAATVRYVNENNTVGTPEAIGDAVTATDGDGDTPVYTLSGRDENSFDINAGNGQLMTKASLDHETKDSYTVTVTADDSTGESSSSARITVTIRVVDLDERPVIINVARPNINHQDTFEYAENGNGPVARFTATDPEGVTPIVWSLLEDGGETQNIDGIDPEDDVLPADVADNASFTISGQGVLEFNASPSYEGVSATDDANYQVVVQASDGGKTQLLSWFKVTVTVTNVNEPGSVTWTVDPDGTGDLGEDTLPQPLLQFRAGAVLVADRH